MTDETLSQLTAIMRRIRGLSVPAGSDYGHGEIAALSKEALELLEHPEDKFEVFRLRRTVRNQQEALRHWRVQSDADAAAIRRLENQIIFAHSVNGALTVALECEKEKRNELVRALELAGIRLGILTARMRACHEETGMHALLDEAEMFCAEARAAANLNAPGTPGPNQGDHVEGHKPETIPPEHPEPPAKPQPPVQPMGDGDPLPDPPPPDPPGPDDSSKA